MANVREKALLSLYDIEYNGAYTNLAVKNTDLSDLSIQDKAFYTELVYGVTRYKLTLDYVISKFSSVKIKKLSKYVLQILRLGVYQIICLNKIPESAAVNESVKLASKYAAKSKGFVNAVLHSVVRERDNIKYPKDKLENLSVKYSFPQDMIKLFSDFDFLEDLLSALNKEPKTTVRINRLKCDNLDETVYQKSPLYEYAAYVKGMDIAKSKDYNDGKFIVQDIAAMMPSVALNPKPNEFCIDVCAAPGGKTTHLAELMENRGRIVAFDIHPHKIDIIENNAMRMGLDIIEPVYHDSRKPVEKFLENADKVLCDVPCSGLGIIARKPDIKWNKDNIEDLPEIQLEILENASKYLKVGGELVYSTCTILKRENEDVVEAFLEKHKNFEKVKIEIPKPLMRDNDGYITFYPNIDNTDGFFIAKIKRCK